MARKLTHQAIYKEDVPIKTFVDMIAPSIIKFNTDHFICGNTYRCVWALREYPTSTSEQAILRHLGEKDGVTLRIYTRQVTPSEEKKIIHNAANKNRMNTANTNDLQQTVTAESNLQDVVTLVCPTARVIGTSEIKDYELVFRGSRYSAVATIELCEGSNVPVLLWGIQPEDEKSLDRYEGYPNFYEKENMEIVLNGSTVSAMVYVMTPGHELGIPSERYKTSIEEGYMDAGFDTDILKNAVDKTVGRIENSMEEKAEQGSLFGMKWW